MKSNKYSKKSNRKFKKGGASKKSNNLYRKYPSEYLKLNKKYSPDDPCHEITSDLVLSTKYAKHPDFSDIVILTQDSNTKAIKDGWYMYILCWIKGNRSLVLLNGMVSDFKSKHFDIITALSQKYKEKDIEYIISGEIYIDISKKKVDMDENSGTFFQDYAIQYNNLKKNKNKIFFNFETQKSLPGNTYIIQTSKKSDINPIIRKDYNIDTIPIEEESLSNNIKNKIVNKRLRLRILSNEGDNRYKVKLFPLNFKNIAIIKSQTESTKFNCALINQIDIKIWQDHIDLFIIPFVQSILKDYTIVFNQNIKYQFEKENLKTILEVYKNRFCKSKKKIHELYSTQDNCVKSINLLGHLCKI